MRSDGLGKRMMMACGEGRRRGQPRKRWMDEIHEVTGMKLVELRGTTIERINGGGLSWWSLEFQELTAQDNKVINYTQPYFLRVSLGMPLIGVALNLTTLVVTITIAVTIAVTISYSGAILIYKHGRI